MALPPNNPATARIALVATRDTRKLVNTFHMARSDGAVLQLTDLQNMVNVVLDWWLNSYRNQCEGYIVGYSATATKQDPANPLQYVGYTGAAGTVSSGQVPANVTAAISWRTGLAGRKFRGRFYHLGVDGDAINEQDTLQGVLVSAYSAVAQYLLNHAVTAGLQMIIFHKASNTFTPINSVIVDNLVDAMRRRLAGRGQ